jgi:hypothetical protein
MYYLQNSVLNSLELREYILGVIVLIRLLSSRCRCIVAMLVLKSILERSPKVKESIEDPFK